MQKIKYIIIFTLLLALGMVYIQLIDYKNITGTLLKDNQSNKNTVQILENKISLLENTTQELKNTIISLEENLSLTQMKLDTQNYTQENNASIDFQDPSQSIENILNNTNDELNLQPNITLDNENQITGFGLEYKTKF